MKLTLMTTYSKYMSVKNKSSILTNYLLLV